MKRKLTCILAVPFLIALGLLLATGGAVSSHSQDSQGDEQRLQHRKPNRTLPETLDPAQFAGSPSAYVAYLLAGRIRPVLAKEPCFCPCHLVNGHQSLLDCFASMHGKGCYLCQQEAIFCYEQTLDRRSVRHIRKILRSGKWTAIDVEKFAKAFLASSTVNNSTEAEMLLPLRDGVH
jgi:hypothetical protein